jgi:hypothetical protein
MRATLEAIGFRKVGDLVDQRMVYSEDAAELTGDAGAVYLFLNADDTVWKIGMTRRGFSRVNYTRVLDGREMRRPHEQRKLALIRDELHDGASQWVLPTNDDPTLLEDLLIVALNPTETRRRRSRREKLLRSVAT